MVTDQALFVSNSADIASVDDAGTVRAKNLGETAVLIRAAGMVTSAIVGVIGPEIANYPAVPRSNFIDEFVFDKLRRFRMAPSELSSDGEFLRRVCLDLAGRLPPPDRVREFLDSKDPKKRDEAHRCTNWLAGVH